MVLVIFVLVKGLNFSGKCSVVVLSDGGMESWKLLKRDRMDWHLRRLFFYIFVQVLVGTGFQSPLEIRRCVHAPLAVTLEEYEPPQRKRHDIGRDFSRGRRS